MRIRELAYLMWESAGRQQGMAMEYWHRGGKRSPFHSSGGRLAVDAGLAAGRFTVSDPSPAAASDAADAPGPAHLDSLMETTRVRPILPGSLRLFMGIDLPSVI